MTRNRGHAFRKPITYGNVHRCEKHCPNCTETNLLLFARLTSLVTPQVLRNPSIGAVRYTWKVTEKADPVTKTRLVAVRYWNSGLSNTGYSTTKIRPTNPVHHSSKRKTVHHHKPVRSIFEALFLGTNIMLTRTANGDWVHKPANEINCSFLSYRIPENIYPDVCGSMKVATQSDYVL